MLHAVQSVNQSSFPIGYPKDFSMVHHIMLTLLGDSICHHNPVLFTGLRILSLPDPVVQCAGVAQQSTFRLPRANVYDIPLACSNPISYHRGTRQRERNAA